MTQPASTCPCCLEEGVEAPDQSRRRNGAFSQAALVHDLRFTCPNRHEWITDRETAHLQGAFLARQQAAE